MDRLDDLVDGMIKKQQKPMLKKGLSRIMLILVHPEPNFSYEDSPKAVQAITSLY